MSKKVLSPAKKHFSQNLPVNDWGFEVTHLADAMRWGFRQIILSGPTFGVAVVKIWVGFRPAE